MSLRAVATLLLVLLVGLPPAFAQSNNGRIEGTVQDPTGAVVPGARLTAVNVKTQAKTEATSGSQGEYVLTALPPGIYRLSVEAGGFRKAEIQSIEVNVGTAVAQIVRLEVGAASESVVVEANAVSVQTTESQVSRAVTMRDID